jgi:hypothetical protein
MYGLVQTPGDAVSCGGYGATEVNVEKGRYCWQTSEVFKNGVKILDVPQNANKNTVKTIDDVTLFLRTGSSMNRDVCTFFSNSFSFTAPAQSIDVKIKDQPVQVFEGQNVDSDIEIINNYRDVVINLTTKFSIETGLANPSTETVSRLIESKLGITTSSYSIPTRGIATALTIEPKADILIPTAGRFSGLYTNSCYGHGKDQVKVEDCEYIYVATVNIEKSKVIIEPKPLFLDKPVQGCESLNGYLESPQGEYCVREGIEKLSCVQMGCPSYNTSIDGVSKEVQRMCTSSGYCSELVYKFGCESDANCEAFGAKCMLAKNGQNVCVNEKIQEIPVYIELPFSCSQSNPCPEGVCLRSPTGASYCEKVVYKYGCESDDDCTGFGAICKTTFNNQAVCVQEIVTEKTVTLPFSCSVSNPCPEGVCMKSQNDLYYCENTVYKYGCETNTDCASYGAQCQTSLNNQKVCIKTQVVEKTVEKLVELPFSCGQSNPCPSGVCTKSGTGVYYCENTVYQYGCASDSDCSSYGASCVVTLNNQRVCLKTQTVEKTVDKIVETVVEKNVFVDKEILVPQAFTCTSTIQCPIDSVCKDDFCLKETTVKLIDIIKEPTYINQTCATFNFCAEGYSCEDRNGMAHCIAEDRSSTLMYIIYGVIGLVALLVVSQIFKKK